MAAEIGALTDEELRRRLRSFNLPDGPVTKTTRKLFETKLKRAMGLNKETEKPLEAQEVEIQNLSVERQGCSADTNSDTENNSLLCDSASWINGRPVLNDVVNQSGNIFYGVCLQLDNIETENDSSSSRCTPVFTDKTEALHCVKKNNGARFRAFSTRNEAEAFASGKLPMPSRHHSHELSPGPAEPISEYKGPKHGEITSFRKLIEKGLLDDVSKRIYSNPKYLISSADTPVIIQEGCHYNSMHVAAKAGQKDICELIINTLNDDEFWSLMYPLKDKSANSQQISKRRKVFLLDLYLNTPDKGGCETPLHFACKFGKADVVEYLLSCPACERTIRNKDGKTAEQVICARVPNCDGELRSRILRMFNKPETVCVPILRSDDNCSSPKIGTPWSPSFHGKHEDIVDSGSPGEARYKVRAYAGPMSPQEAEKFCYTLRSPRATPDKQAKFRHIKRSDSEKGLERVARKVAKSQNILWREYWKFLDCFTDLSSSEGLAKFEEYLKAKTEEYKSNLENLEPLKTPVSSKCPLDESPRGNLTCDDVFDGSGSTPKSDKSLPDRIRFTPYSGTRNPNIKNFRSRLNLEESPEDRADVQLDSNGQSKGNDLNIQLGNADVSRSNERDICKKTEHDVRTFPEQLTDEEKRCIKEKSLISPDANSLSPDYPKGSLDFSNCSEDSLSGLITEFQMLNLEESPNSADESSVAIMASECSPTEEGAQRTVGNSRAMVDSNDICLFIEGLQPSKVDLDVYRTIKTITVDPGVFPYMARWQALVRSFSKNTRQAWPSPGSPRYFKSRNAIPKTWSC